MDKPKLYPLKFIPQLKEKVWGGTKLRSHFNKKGESTIGESWELSGVEGTISKVANGNLEGQEINQLLKIYNAHIAGERVYAKYGNQFPLLFKFIDAAQDLSVQLHPNDAVAKKRHNAFGKTEMWYILQAETDAKLILGFNKKLDKASYTEILEAKKITSVLRFKAVQKDKAYFIEPGLVHAIGAGVLLAEIQQTSDITYRIYDWNRPDTNGKLRQLHTEQALDAIQFNTNNPEIAYKNKLNTRVLLASCPYFITHKLVLTATFSIQNFENESFKVYMCIEGIAEIVIENTVTSIQKGETILIPACLTDYQIKTENATFLEVYIP